MSCPAARVTISANIGKTSVQIAGLNTSRNSFLLYNNASSVVYVTYGAVATVAGCSFCIAPNASYWHALPLTYYTGPISAIRATDAPPQQGPINMTEFYSV